MPYERPPSRRDHDVPYCLLLDQVSTDNQSRYPHGETEKQLNPPPPGVHCGAIERFAQRGADCRAREDAAVDLERSTAAEKSLIPGCRMLDKKDKGCADFA